MGVRRTRLLRGGFFYCTAHGEPLRALTRVLFFWQLRHWLAIRSGFAHEWPRHTPHPSPPATSLSALHHSRYNRSSKNIRLTTSPNRQQRRRHGDSRQRLPDHGRRIGPGRGDRAPLDENGGKVVLADMNEGRRRSARERTRRRLRQMRREPEEATPASRRCRDATRHACAASSIARASRRHQDGRQGRPAPARPVREDDRDQPDRHVQHDPARGDGDVEERAERGRRARRDRQHGLGRGLRRPDRPGGVCGVEGRRGRHDAADRARPVAQRRSA